MFSFAFTMSILNYLDPTRWFGSGNYQNFWNVAFHTILFGAGAKIVSVIFLLFGFWLLARRENIIGFIMFVIMSFIFAYFGGFFRVF